MALTVTILGCSGGYPRAGSACAGYLVRGENTTVWLDAGSGTLANLQTHIDIDDLDAVILTHEHPDHCRDADLLYVAYRYGKRVREGLPVYAPTGVKELLYFDTEPVFEWRIVADGSDVTIGGLRARFSRTDHGPETLAVRIDADGRSLAYSADTGPKWSFSRLGSGINLAISECTLDEDEEGSAQHLSARQAGALAEEAGVEHLVLTHVWPESDPSNRVASASAVYSGRLSLAANGEEYSV